MYNALAAINLLVRSIIVDTFFLLCTTPAVLLQAKEECLTFGGKFNVIKQSKQIGLIERESPKRTLAYAQKAFGP